MADPKRTGGSAPQASDIAEDAQSIAAKLADTAQEKARGLAATAEEKARQLADEKKREAAEQVAGVAEVVDSVAEQVERALPPAGAYVRGVSEQIHRVSSTLRDRSVDDLMDEARRFAQQRPGLVLGGCLIAGFGLARFLKASADRRAEERARRQASARPRSQQRREASRPEYPSDVAVEGAAPGRAAQGAGPSAS
jgi:ABC-type transporter Mla subunit MlaD